MCCLMLLAAPLWGAPPPKAAPAVSLPEPIRQTLDQEYPGWKLAPVTPEIQQTFSRHKAGRSPSFAWADFDRDGRRDYAVQIALTQPEQEEQILLVFMSRDPAYQETILESRGLDPSVYLWTSKKAVAETGPDGQDKLVTKELLVVMGGPTGDTTYAFENDKFHEIKSDPLQSGVDSR